MSLDCPLDQERLGTVYWFLTISTLVIDTICNENHALPILWRAIYNDEIVRKPKKNRRKIYPLLNKEEIRYQ